MVKVSSMNMKTPFFQKTATPKPKRKTPEEAFEKTIIKLENNGLSEIIQKEIRFTEVGDIWRIIICGDFFSPNKK